MAGEFPRNELESALVDGAAGRRSVEEVVEVLCRSQVWVPMTAQRDPATPPSFPVLTDQGQSYVAVFTSEEELRSATPEGTPHVAPPVTELRAAVPRHLGLAVNPGGTVGLPVAAAMLDQVLGSVSVAAAGTGVHVGDPAEEPTGLLDAAGQELARVEAVTQARRCWAQVEGRPAGLVLGLTLEPDTQSTRQEALAAVGSAVGAAAYQEGVDVVFAADADVLTEWMREHSEPFYVSGR